MYARLAFRGSRSDRTKSALKNTSKDNGDSDDSGIGSDDDDGRMGGWNPPAVAGADSRKLHLSFGDMVSSNVGRRATSLRPFLTPRVFFFTFQFGKFSGLVKGKTK